MLGLDETIVRIAQRIGTMPDTALETCEDMRPVNELRMRARR